MVIYKVVWLFIKDGHFLLLVQTAPHTNLPHCLGSNSTSIGLKVLFVTADGAGPNRKFFKLHMQADTTQSDGRALNDFYPYRTKNRYSPDGNRWLYFIADPPHLIKTTRNCLQHSAFSGTRLMTVSLFKYTVQKL